MSGDRRLGLGRMALNGEALPTAGYGFGFSVMSGLSAMRKGQQKRTATQDQNRLSPRDQALGVAETCGSMDWKACIGSATVYEDCTMGWTFCSPSRATLVDRLLNRHPDHLERVDHALSGNALWVVYRALRDNSQFIALYMLAGSRGSDRDEYRWGYKDLDESMGPCNEDCPQRLLKASTCHDPVAVAWRQRCLDRHAQRRANNTFVRGLVAGSYFRCDHRILRLRDVRKGWLIGFDLTSGETFRFRRSWVAPVCENPREALMTTVQELLSSSPDAMASPLFLRSDDFGWMPWVNALSRLDTIPVEQPVFLVAAAPIAHVDYAMPQVEVTGVLRALCLRALGVIDVRSSPHTSAAAREQLALAA